MKVLINELIEYLLYNFMVMPAHIYVDCYLLGM